MKDESRAAVTIPPPLTVYSERNASTGSFLAATPAGINPAISVSIMLMAISMIQAATGSWALIE